MFALRLATDQMCAQREHAAAQVLLNSMRADFVAGAITCQTDRQTYELREALSVDVRAMVDGPMLACRSRLRRSQCATLSGCRPILKMSGYQVDRKLAIISWAQINCQRSMV